MKVLQPWIAGTVPSFFGALNSLRAIRLSRNQLTGQGALSFGIAY